MMIPRKIYAHLILASVLSCTLSVVGHPTLQAIAQGGKDLRFNTTANTFEGEGRPPSRTSAGSRDACLTQLVALVPGEGDVEVDADECAQVSQTRVALTVSEQPTFWFYVPEWPDAEVTAELVLLDDSQQPIVIQPVTLPEEAGIVGVPLSQPLDLDTTHRWVFTVESTVGSAVNSIFVEGLVRRIAPDTTLKSELESALSNEEKVKVYAEHGIWHEALTLLVGLHQSAASDSVLSTDWFDFLSSVGLGAIAPAPILNCCLLSEPQ